MTTQTEKNGISPEHVLFTEPDLFLLANQVSQPDSPGWASVLCENFAENKAICACGSSEDAMLNAILISKPGKRYYSIHAGRFVLAAFILDHSGILRLDMYLGCQACNGRLIVRRSARPTTHAMRHEMVVPPERTRHIYGRLDEDTAHECQQLYNSVDLLAIHECFERAARWLRARRDRAVAAATRKLLPLAPIGTDCNQIALHGIEGEWWFASTSVLEAH